MDFSAAVTVNNPFGQGEIQVDDLDFTGGTAQLRRDVRPAGATAGAAAGVPADLTVGTWVEIRATGEKEPRAVAKLSYVSPLKSRFLFVDRHGKSLLECSRTELVRRFSLGELLITKQVDEPPLFDRLAQGLVGKLGGSKARR